MGAVGEGVAVIEELPVGGGDLLAGRDGKGDAGLGDAAALLLDLLSLLALQARQEAGEIGVRLGLAIAPMELHRTAHRPSGVAGCRLIGLVEKEQVCRREPRRAGEPLHALQEEQPVLVRSRQKARPRHRREGDGAEQLRVVVEAVSAVSVCPGPVEDVFAVGVILQVKGAGGEQLAFALEQKEVRRPSRLGDGAARRVQGAQIGEPDERRRCRLRRDQRIPGVGVDGARVVADAQGPSASSGVPFGVVHLNGSIQRAHIRAFA